MDAMECILSRRSIRKFKEVPVEFSKIGEICEAGLAAPSAGNLQDFRIICILDKTRLNFINFWMNNTGFKIEYQPFDKKQLEN